MKSITTRATGQRLYRTLQFALVSTALIVTALSAIAAENGIDSSRPTDPVSRLPWRAFPSERGPHRLPPLQGQVVPAPFVPVGRAPLQVGLPDPSGTPAYPTTRYPTTSYPPPVLPERPVGRLTGEPASPTESRPNGPRPADRLSRPASPLGATIARPTDSFFQDERSRTESASPVLPPADRGLGQTTPRLATPEPPVARELRAATDPIVKPLRDEVKQVEQIPAAQVIAIVGDQPILAGDLLGQINDVLRKNNVHDVTPEQRDELLRRFLPGAIDSKLVYLEYLRQVPADKLPEVEGRLKEVYNEHQLQKSMDEAGVRSVAEFEEKLREIGSSLDKQRRQFGETVLAHQLLKEKVDQQVDISREDLLQYYREHQADYEFKASARWEELTTQFDQFSTREEARVALAKMGNRVWSGEEWGVVAREVSQGFTAREGGRHDWTDQGSLVSDAMDDAIFSLPLNKMSEILEDRIGFHIVRVLERKEEGRVPFTDCQAEIRKKIESERMQQRRGDYIQNLREKTFVWTRFDRLASAGPRP